MRLLERLKEKSLRNRVLFFFLPLIIIAVLIVGGLSYYFEVGQLKKNARYLINNTVNQTGVLLNDRFLFMFQELVAMTQSPAAQGLMLYDDSQNANEKYTDMLSLSNQFNTTYFNNFNIIDSLYFCSKSGVEVKYFEDDVPQRIDMNVNAWMIRYQGAENGYYWLNAHTDTVFVTQRNRQVISMFSETGNSESNSGGVLLMNMKSSYFKDILKNVKVSSNGYMLLISQDGVMGDAKTKGDILSGDVISTLHGRLGKSGTFDTQSVDGTKMIVVYQSLKINKWVIAAVIPQSDLLSGAYQFLIFLVVILILVILVSIYLAICFAKKLTNPIEYLSGQLMKFDAGNMNVDFSVKDTNEIGILANGLSCLVITIEGLVDEVKNEQQKKAKVELLALQSQIKPHFLYNTLGSIKHLIDMNKPDMASQMCGALEKFYKIGISKGKEIITVRDEISHATSYLLIQKMRYGYEFSYDINISDDILDALILKLTVQPIVENSIYHGIKNKDGPGVITISGWRENDKTVLEVFDDGVGMSEEKLESLRNSIGLPEIEENPITFGLRNVNQRIILHFGKEYGLKIESVEGVYTRVRIYIPFNVANLL